MNEFTLGTCVGMVQTVIGHPLDTLKTNYQNNQNLKLNKNAVGRLFRGITYPLFSTTIINGFLFYSNDSLKQYNKNSFISGFMTGIICSPMINIFETCKVKRQLNEKININFIKYSKLGFTATLIRESFGASLYFGTYDYLRENNYNPFVSGSSAGVISWLLTYPFDVVKTRLQSGLDKTWKQAILRGGLINGLSICLFRSFIVNGFAFMAYDYIKHQNVLD